MERVSSVIAPTAVSIRRSWNFNILFHHHHHIFQSFSRVCLSVTPWTAPHQAPLSSTVSQSLLQFMSIESVTLSNPLILCCSLLLLPSIFSSIRVFSNESSLCIRWPNYWSFSFSPSSEYSGLISFRIDWLNLSIQVTLRVFSITTVWRHQFFSAQPSLQSNSHICAWLLEKP